MIHDIIEIAEDAGKEILSVYDSEKLFGSKANRIKKQDGSPLTLADKLASTLICTRLQKLTPNIPILCEETAEEQNLMDDSVRKNWKKYWCVDPLDGTKEFLKRNGEFTVNIALIKNHQPILGVVHVPVTGETYWAEQGKGAWKNTNPPKTPHNYVRIKCKPFYTPETAPEDYRFTIAISRSHMNEETKNFLEQFRDPELLSAGSSLKLLLVADGTVDLYPRFGPTREWDIAASHIIVTEAGGEVVQAATDKPLTYNKPDLLNPYFIAVGRGTPEEVPSSYS